MIGLAWVQAGVMSLPPDQGPRPPAFPATTELVRLDALALDGKVALRGLGAHDFELRDNGVPQSVRVSPAATLPSEIVVLFDTSESVKGPKLKTLRECARTVTLALREGDQAALITFSDVVELRSGMATGGAHLLEGLKDVHAGGSTALFDALFAGLAVSGRGGGRPILILFTDGRDNVSWLSADDVVATARLSEASIYAVTTSSIGVWPRSPGEPPTWASIATASDDEFLQRITGATGGRLLHAGSAASLKAQLLAVLDEIAARYIIAYEPVGVAREGWHQVQVRLRGRRGAVVVRPGYLMAPARVP
jgi:VWFA-related protein